MQRGLKRALQVTVAVLGLGAVGVGTAAAFETGFELPWSACSDPSVDIDPSPNHQDMRDSADCPAPYAITPATPPHGDKGSLVVIGDSFTAGEGAPQVLAVTKDSPGGEYWAG